MKKHSNWIFTAVIIIAFVGGLILVAQKGEKGTATISEAVSSSGDAAGNATLATEESFFDFGNVSMANGKVKHSFVVKNTGEALLTIKKMYTSCMCTSATLSVNSKKFGPFGMQGHGFMPTIKAEILPGESGNVEVVFDPAAHGPAGIGKISRVVYLENTVGAPIEFGIAANVTP